MQIYSAMQEELTGELFGVLDPHFAGSLFYEAGKQNC